jgi:hypothetical protein
MQIQGVSRQTAGGELPEAAWYGELGRDLSTPRPSARMGKQFQGAPLKMTVEKSMAQNECIGAGCLRAELITLPNIHAIALAETPASMLAGSALIYNSRSFQFSS